MPLTVRSTGSADTALPPAGTHNAVCVDIVDKGMQATSFGTKQQLSVVWEIDEPHPAGGRFRVRKTYTASLHEKASLTRDLEAWRGRRFTDAEREGFDVETILGAPGLVTVQLNESQNGRTYANVVSVAPLPRGMAPLAASPGFEREMDRDEGYDARSPHSRLAQAAAGAPPVGAVMPAPAQRPPQQGYAAPQQAYAQSPARTLAPAAASVTFGAENDDLPF